MRVVMRVATRFETWATLHIEFNEIDDVWPYMMEDKFGTACVTVIGAECLAQFDDSDCLRAALHMRLPVKVRDGLPVPGERRVADAARVTSGVHARDADYAEDGKFRGDVQVCRCKLPLGGTPAMRLLWPDENVRSRTPRPAGCGARWCGGGRWFSGCRGSRPRSVAGLPEPSPVCFAGAASTGRHRGGTGKPGVALPKIRPADCAGCVNYGGVSSAWFPNDLPPRGAARASAQLRLRPRSGWRFVTHPKPIL